MFEMQTRVQFHLVTALSNIHEGPQGVARCPTFRGYKFWVECIRAVCYLKVAPPCASIWTGLIYVSFNLSAEASFNIACKFNRAKGLRPSSLQPANSTNLWHSRRSMQHEEC